MAEEQGQAEVAQPTHAIFQENLNPHAAAALLSEMIEKEDSQPRDEAGKFVAKQPAAEAPAEEPAAEAPAEEPAAEPEAPRLKLKIKYKGEDRELEEPEAVELAQKGYDYTQKSQALAKEREEMQGKIKAEVEARQKAFEQTLEMHKKALEKIAGLEEVDLNKLALEDPNRAQQEFFKRLQFQQTMMAIEAEQQKVTQQRQSEFQANMRKQAEESVEKLQTEIPGWDNALYGKILKTAANDYGFTKQEANSITDHRAIKVLHDAMKYRELQAAKPKTVDKKVAAVPKVIKPGTAEKPDPKAGESQSAMDKLSKSGSRQDAQAYALALMKAGRL